MQLTSLDAFYKLPACPLAVLKVFVDVNGKPRALSSHQVADELNWEICSVSGRITDLRKRFGFLEYYSVGVRSNGCSEKILTITKSGLQWLNDRRD
jgi:hypothetical protein